MRLLAVEHIEQGRRRVLTHHGSHSGGVHRHRKTYLLAPLKTGYRGRAEHIDLATADRTDLIRQFYRHVAHLQGRQVQCRFYLFSDLLAHLYGVPLGLVTTLRAERCEVRQVTQGEGVAGANPLKRIAVSQQR
ncbi:hypothetical protein D3C72_1597480 [compost metagenome]